MGKRDGIERAIKDALNEYASEFGEDHFEISVIVSIENCGTLDIDTDIEFVDH